MEYYGFIIHGTFMTYIQPKIEKNAAMFADSNMNMYENALMHVKQSSL